MPFSDPIVGGTTLIREAIRSANFVTGVSGWSIDRDGDAEFNDLISRGILEVGGVGTGNSRMVIGEMPAFLVSQLEAVAGIIFYSGFDSNDDDYYFIVTGSPGDSLNQIYYGYVRNANELHITKHEFATVIPGAPPDETDMSLESNRIDIGISTGTVIIRSPIEWRVDADPVLTVQDAQAALQTTTSATFVLLAVTCGVAFTAPPSGRVLIHYGVFHDHSTTGFVITSPEVRTGSTVGSGTVVVAANDDECVQHTGTDEGRAGASLLVTGLTAGTVYNVSLWTRTSAATASIRRRRVIVAPAF